MLVLQVVPGGRYIDGTLGGATHTETLLRRSEPNGHVLSLDVNPSAITQAKKRLRSFDNRWSGKEINFRFLDVAAEEEGMESCDGILLDLGFSSDELEDPTKGLSFLKEGVLDMRFGPSSNEDGLTAADIVNSWREPEIEKMIRVFGEEKFSRRIAHGIIEARRAAPIVSTLDLVAIIKRAVPGAYEGGRIHPATRTFQALRMAVNDEVPALKDAIAASFRALHSGGRLAVITFHSIEDRIVKKAFQEKERWEVVNKKPILPSAKELLHNPRSRSAKLRAATKQ